MLLQSHTGEIHLLPALPKAWPSGRVKGLRARGGFEVDMVWTEGKLVTVIIQSLTGINCRVRYSEQVIALHLKPSAAVTLNERLKIEQQDKH
jgi:alpha-L-fucosidase 2